MSRINKASSSVEHRIQCQNSVLLSLEAGCRDRIAHADRVANDIFFDLDKNYIFSNETELILFPRDHSDFDPKPENVGIQENVNIQLFN